MERIFQLLAQWRERLGIVRGLAAASDDGWLWRLRARVLTFLISRYGERDGDDARIVGNITRVPTPSFCLVDPEDHPPRQTARLSDLIRSIHTENDRARARLRWRLF
jgi:hypothetical protein